MSGELNPTNQIHVDNFKERVSAGKGDSYMLTIARDGESPVRSIYFYDNAIDATTGYEAYTDWGFAKEFLTVELHEPIGRVHSKVLRRPKGGECTFVRQDYNDATAILLVLNGTIEQDHYNYLVYEFGKLFSKDNQRFDHKRFLVNLGYTGEENDQH